MGSWGYGPLQNDEAADWIGEIGDYCAERVGADLTAGHEEVEWEEVRAACWLLEKFGNPEGESGSPLFLVASAWPPDALLSQFRQGIDWLTWLRDESGWHEERTLQGALGDWSIQLSVG